MRRRSPSSRSSNPIPFNRASTSKPRSASSMTPARRARRSFLSTGADKETVVPEGQVVDQSPIINDPYREPAAHWEFGEGTPVKRDQRRVSGYLPPGGEDR